MKPIRFASHYRHNKLYKQYDDQPQVWKSAMYNYILCKRAEHDIEVDAEKLAKQVEFTDYPFEHESCDYWLFQPPTKAMKYAKHASCQFMSFINYKYLVDAFPGKKFYHVSDYDMYNGSGHFYVFDSSGEIFDPQGLALKFDIDEYTKTFNEESITSIDIIENTILDYGWSYRERINTYAKLPCVV